MNPASWIGAVLLCFTVAASAHGQSIDFERQIRPLLLHRCGGCHGAEVQKSGLRLDAAGPAFRGGDSGPVIIPASAERSELILRITSNDASNRMPPETDALPDAEVRLLRDWIDQGAIWPLTEYDRTAAIDTRLQHWAWQPVNPPTTDSFATRDQAASDQIDQMLSQKLAEQGLRMSKPADRRTLIRRLSFDLLGLPPSPERIQQFAAEQDPLAWSRLVEEFLASPQYGERWAQHWLDIAHYADTHGFERDQRRDHAWRYRDWVIRALNDDLPYDQFLRDQIAGDVLRPNDPDAVAATGFLAAGPWDFVGQKETPSPVLKRLARADDLDDMVTQVMTAACAVTVNCARCHDHKLDPISQREYYSLWAVFAGVRRGDRILSATEDELLRKQRGELERRIAERRAVLAEKNGSGWGLADIVAGGDGRGSGAAGGGIDPGSGEVPPRRRGFLEDVAVNRFRTSPVRFVDGVVIPDGSSAQGIVISSTGLVAQGIPATSGQAWDAIRSGPVNSPFSTELDGIDFAAEGHSLLSIHANAAVTFDLDELRNVGATGMLRFRSLAGYFGQTPTRGASLHVLLDGQVCFERLNIGRNDGLAEIDLAIPEATRFLTLMSTDGGNGIGHDQIGLGDARLVQADSSVSKADEAEITRLQQELRKLKEQLEQLPEPARIYAVTTETPPEVFVLQRGNPEQPGDPVIPAALSCIGSLDSSLGQPDATDAQRRIALADWIVDPANPLTRRVIVNRIWQHHFGSGIVETPSDFGLGGALPTHPELLDFLAARLLTEEWSLKAMHRLICNSRAYQQSSIPADSDSPDAQQVDSANRLLWRQNPRRVDAESLRDAVLTVSGRLNPTMYGPGYQDFEYREEYAPVYNYITADSPELWRRCIYRFVVRTTPHQFMTTLDCPNPANLTPTRSVTTTAMQSLAMMNNEFIIRQAGYFAERLEREAGPTLSDQIQLAFQLAFGRSPSAEETQGAIQLIDQNGLPQFCRILFNANEFVYID